MTRVANFSSLTVTILNSSRAQRQANRKVASALQLAVGFDSIKDERFARETRTEK